ncbi:hypothetical protein TL16_g13378, partial [Triparma laevis f. inornata]
KLEEDVNGSTFGATYDALLREEGQGSNAENLAEIIGKLYGEEEKPSVICKLVEELRRGGILPEDLLLQGRSA